jgi:purine-nucleoside phosphorylase
LTVEMEAAALFAVAQHRKAILGQILYAGDVVSSDRAWDGRDWQQADWRGRVLTLAMKACLEL